MAERLVCLRDGCSRPPTVQGLCARHWDAYEPLMGAVGELMREGLPQREVARRAGISYPTARAIMHAINGTRPRAWGGGPPPHGSIGQWRDRGCDCTACSRARDAYHAAQYARRGPLQERVGRSGAREYLRDHARDVQEESRRAAGRHYEPWTGEQLAIAVDRGRTVRDAAGMLGRSVYAVRAVRRAVADPDAEGHDRYVLLLRGTGWREMGT